MKKVNGKAQNSTPRQSKKLACVITLWSVEVFAYQIRDFDLLRWWLLFVQFLGWDRVVVFIYHHVTLVVGAVLLSFSVKVPGLWLTQHHHISITLCQLVQRCPTHHDSAWDVRRKQSQTRLKPTATRHARWVGQRCTNWQCAPQGFFCILLQLTAYIPERIFKQNISKDVWWRMCLLGSWWHLGLIFRLPFCGKTSI